MFNPNPREDSEISYIFVLNNMRLPKKSRFTLKKDNFREFLISNPSQLTSNNVKIWVKKVFFQHSRIV